MWEGEEEDEVRGEGRGEEGRGGRGEGGEEEEEEEREQRRKRRGRRDGAMCWGAGQKTVREG